MGELLLELLSEEIPARMQRRAIDDLTGLIRDKLAGAEILPETLTGYVTPRRLTVIADGIPIQQPDRNEERRGPRVGAPEQAIGGFLRSAGLGSIDQCEVRGDFHFAKIKRPGRDTAEVLPELIHAAMTALSWPKSMRFPASTLRWVRPLNSVICLFDGAVLKLPLGEVPVSRVTQGHRFLSSGEISVDNAADYRAKLEAAHVVLDWAQRREIIDRDLRKLAEDERLKLKDDPALLDEVTGLVEYPVVLMGSIDADFVRPLPDGLPPEVLATAMRTHQKYFSCLNQDGTPAPRFLFVANNVTPDGGKTIAAGNERVLRARLSDARFFWDQDRKVRLEDRVEALKQRVYHEKLGSVYDKVKRMEYLAEYLADYVPGADKSLARRAAHLAKADLSTGMVGEFPELQGVMGRYYARNDGVGSAAADAIADHYKPLGPNDTCPSASESVIVALADKIDTLVAFFAIDERPSGSGDPFALRRAAQGVIRLILEHELRLPLRGCFLKALGEDHSVETVKAAAEAAAIQVALIDFVFDRLRVHARDQGIGHDLIAAARRPEARGRAALNEDDITRFMRRVRALQKFLKTDDGANLLVAYKRASNIVSIEERGDRQSYSQPVNMGQLPEPEEEVLAQTLFGLERTLEPIIAAERFDQAMSRLATLRNPIDEFFERVTVNTEDKELRENRLRLLARIRATMNQVADFSQIEG